MTREDQTADAPVNRQTSIIAKVQRPQAITHVKAAEFMSACQVIPTDIQAQGVVDGSHLFTPCLVCAAHEGHEVWQNTVLCTCK